MFTTKSTFREMMDDPMMADFRDYVLGNCEVPDIDNSFETMESLYPDWVAKSIVTGLNAVKKQSTEPRVFSVYSAEQIAQDSSKAEVKLFYMPGDAGKPFVLDCPGGAYVALCHLKEGFPVGAALNERGYHCFILNYRLADEKTALFPKPMEDAAAAVRWILDHAGEFDIDPEGYAVMGFSAGGHLAASWGTDELGAAKYGLPKPAAVLCSYPLLGLSDDVDSGLEEEVRKISMRMLGAQYTKADQQEYSIFDKLSKDYPAFYLWHCEDDPIVPFGSSEAAAKVMEQQGGRFQFKKVAHGGHGFGLGEYSEADGWLDEAVALWESVR